MHPLNLTFRPSEYTGKKTVLFNACYQNEENNGRGLPLLGKDPEEAKPGDFLVFLNPPGIRISRELLEDTDTLEISSYRNHTRHIVQVYEDCSGDLVALPFYSYGDDEPQDMDYFNPSCVRVMTEELMHLFDCLDDESKDELSASFFRPLPSRPSFY